MSRLIDIDITEMKLQRIPKYRTNTCVAENKDLRHNPYYTGNPYNRTKYTLWGHITKKHCNCNCMTNKLECYDERTRHGTQSDPSTCSSCTA